MLLFLLRSSALLSYGRRRSVAAVPQRHSRGAAAPATNAAACALQTTLN